MKNEIITFKNEMFGEVRTMCDEKGVPWFVGKDVAEVLRYADPQKAMKSHVDEEDKLTRQIAVSGQRRKVITINESGLYSLILSSKLPQAKVFKRWVTSEVLPQIRKTGGYIPVEKDDNEKSMFDKTVGILKRTLEQKDALIAAKDKEIYDKTHQISSNEGLIDLQCQIMDRMYKELQAQYPKVEFAEAVTCSEDCICIGDLAKLISSNGIEVGRTKLFRWMRKHGYMFKCSRRPIQKWVDKGFLEVEENIIDTGRRIRLEVTTKVTGKGQEYFVNGFVSGKFYIERE